MLNKFKQTDLADAHINMNPMIDVVFQLLLFFIIASSFTKANQVQLDLPESTSSEKAAEEQTLVVTFRVVDGKPDLRLNDQGTDLAQLGDAMKAAAPTKATPRVDLRIDKSVPYQDVMSLMDAVRDAGFPRFSLQTLGRESRKH